MREMALAFGGKSEMRRAGHADQYGELLHILYKNIHWFFSSNLIKLFVNNVGIYISLGTIWLEEKTGFWDDADSGKAQTIPCSQGRKV